MSRLPTNENRLPTDELWSSTAILTLGRRRIFIGVNSRMPDRSYEFRANFVREFGCARPLLIKSEIWAWLVGKYDRSSGSHPSTSDGSWYLKVCRNKGIKYQVDFCTTMYRVKGVRTSIRGVRIPIRIRCQNFHQTGVLVPGKIHLPGSTFMLGTHESSGALEIIPTGV